MKIYCEKCQKDISDAVDENIEKFKCGRISCPHCKKLQQRFISELDLMLYFTINCLIYILAVFLIVKIFNKVLSIYYLLIWIIILYVLIYFLQKYLARSIYQEAYFKKDYKNLEIMQDKNIIQKRMRVQYALFICLVILFGSGNYGYWIFAIAIGSFTIVTGIKLYLLIKQERKQLKQ